MLKSFAIRKREILADLEHVSFKTQLDPLRVRVNQMSKDLQEHYDDLLEYDIKMLKDDIKELNEELEKKRASLDVKFKFKNRSFKVKNDKKLADVASIDDADSSRSQVSISDRTNEFVKICCNNSYYLFKNLKNCAILIEKSEFADVHSSMNFENCENLYVKLSINGPTFITGVSDSTFEVDCQQLRIHNCSRLKMLTKTNQNDVIIEKSTDMEFFNNGMLDTLKVHDFDLPSVVVDNPHYKLKSEDLNFDWIKTEADAKRFLETHTK